MGQGVGCRVGDLGSQVLNTQPEDRVGTGPPPKSKVSPRDMGCLRTESTWLSVGISQTLPFHPFPELSLATSETDCLETSCSILKPHHPPPFFGLDLHPTLS